MTDHTRSGLPKRTGKRGAGYPKRPPHFFHRYVRLLAKSCVANEIGADGCWLLSVIAATEDSRRYRSAPSFFNTQLAPLCGCSIDKLARVRRKCVDLNWLHYEHGGKGVPGYYWVLLHNLDGVIQEAGPLGELESDFSPQSAEQSAERTARQTRDNCGENRETSAKHPYPSLSCPPPPPESRPAVTPVAAVDANSWKVVEGELADIGLATAGSTVRAARERDHSPETVRALIAHYLSRPGAWEPGAIRSRILESPATLAPHQGWPEPRAVVSVDRDRETTAARLAEEAEHASKVASERKALDALEEQYGDDLDALPIGDLAQLVPEGPARNSLQSKGWRSGMLRGIVLRRWHSERTDGKESTP